jgi:hypothetical protein
MLLGALVLGAMAFQNTNKGYRHGIIFVAVLLLLFVSFFGFVGHLLKLNNQMDRMLYRKAPAFRAMASPINVRWSRPGDGLIGGEIIRVDLDNFALKSMHGEDWKIYFTQNTKLGGDIKIIVGERVGVIGERVDDYAMRALLIHCLNFNHDNMHRGPSPARMPMWDAGK